MNAKPPWNIILNACQLEARVDKEVCDLVDFLICQSIYTFQQDIFAKICFFPLHDCFETIKNAKSLNKKDRFAFSIHSSLRFRIKSL